MNEYWAGFWGAITLIYVVSVITKSTQLGETRTIELREIVAQGVVALVGLLLANLAFLGVNVL